MTKGRSYIDALPKPLLSDILEGRCIPIVGAGFSRNASLPPGQQMPLWEDMGRMLAQQMEQYPYTSAIDAISAFAHEYYRPKLVEQLRSILHVDTAQPGSAHVAFADLPFDIVVTTNFDFLLERAYESRKRPYCPVIDEDQLSVGGPVQGTLIHKIHGDLNHPRRLVVTEEDYDAFLDKYPLVCTYVANLLISRTPLFIGYSLEDPDFRQLWQVIGSRLGNLRRSAYTLSVDARISDITRFERRGVKVIRLDGSSVDYPQILTSLFEELRAYWLEKIPEVSTVSDEDSRIELSLPLEAQSRLCFFAIPYQLLSFYRHHVFPVFERRGFTPITGADMMSPGESIMAKITSLIERSTLIVADISNSTWVHQELAMALSRGRKVIVVGEDDKASLPLAIQHAPYIRRPKELDSPETEEFLARLDQSVVQLSEDLIDSLSHEPVRLLESGEYRAAVVLAISLLETELRERLDVQEVKSPFSLGRLITTAVQAGLITENTYPKIRKWMDTRNRAVHTREAVDKRTASSIVNGVMGLITDMQRPHGTG